MPKRNPPETNRRRNEAPHVPASRSPGFLSLVIFWPFHLFNLLTRGLATPFKILTRLVGYPMLMAAYPLVILALVYGIRANQAKFDLSRLNAMPERSIIYDRLGVELGRIHGEKRSLVPLNNVSQNFRKAILAREDERFYKHGAIDPIGIVRAALKNTQGKREGASTITQQLASDVFKLKIGEKRGDVLRQLDRKFLEIAIAYRIEAAMEKDDILAAYINQINWGINIKGISEASRIYFEKHPAELTLSQSALLAGIVRGPDAYNPFRSMESSVREQHSTLERMVVAKVITREEAEAAKKEPIEVRPTWRREADESYVMDAIIRDLEWIEQDYIDLGGLSIITTIDQRVQQKSEEALDKKLREVERMSGYPHQTRSSWKAMPEAGRKAPAYIQGAAVVVENRTGDILAVVGGRDAKESKYNRALQSQRQIGSIFKPFVYLAAFDKGLRPSTEISDGPIERGEIKGGGTWRPDNSDGKFGGMHPVSYGLIRSRNTMSVRVGNYAGIQDVKEVARMVGFDTPMPENPASYLGAWEATPFEVASAYSIFPNDGVRNRPHLISQIKDRDGNVMYSSSPLPGQAATAGSAWSVSRILNEVTTHGTAASVKRLGFDKPCGGKTGTTNDFKDAWFAGYTSSLTCAVWVGFDIPKKTMEGGYGSTLALPVWVDIMKTSDRLGYKAGELHGKVKLVNIRLCRLSGRRATAGCEENHTAYSDDVPADIALPANDLCPHHPAKAEPVDESDLTPPEPAPLRAEPVRDLPQSRRAEPVREIPQSRRAVPVKEAPPRALPVE